MFEILLIGWLVSGWVINWHTAVTIDPIVTRGDAVALFLFGVIGPFALIWWLIYALPKFTGRRKPVKFLSRL